MSNEFPFSLGVNYGSRGIEAEFRRPITQGD